MVQPTILQDVYNRASALQEARQGSLFLARILGPVAIPPPTDYSGQSPYATAYNLQLVDAHLEPMPDRQIQAVLAAQTMWQMQPDFLYDRRNSLEMAGTTSVVAAHFHTVTAEHDHLIIDPDDHATLPSYVQAAFAEPNGGYFALVQPVRAGRASFWVITGFILTTAIEANPTTPD